VAAGSSAIISETASNPPAEAPIPTTGKDLSEVSVIDLLAAGNSLKATPLQLEVVTIKN
jgi:hypothetical protein